MSTPTRLARMAARTAGQTTLAACRRAPVPSIVSCVTTLPRVVFCRHSSSLPAESSVTSMHRVDGKLSKFFNALPFQHAEDLTNGGSPYAVAYRTGDSDAAFYLTPRNGSVKHPCPFVWLRDNCRCSKCVNPDTMQKNFSIFELPDSLAPNQATVESTGLRVVWNHEEHESFYDWNFLKRYLDHGTRPMPDKTRLHFWGSDIAESPPSVNYAEVMDGASESGLGSMLDHIMRYGFVFIDDTPFDDPVHTKRLLERIGPIRETHYGGFYDFKPDMAKADTAYTNVALPAHTDTTYFTDPAGLQAFHLLSHEPPPDAPEGAEPTGGESLLVDGYRAVDILQTEDKRAFMLLCSMKLPWHASGNKGVTITSDLPQPVLKFPSRKAALADTSVIEKEHLIVRWNNDDRGVVPLFKSCQSFYDAAEKWDQILKRRESEYWFQLKPGRTLIFDNYRVLHGRSAFTGLRRICGGYISRDDYMSRWRNTNLSREEVLSQVIGW